MRSDMQEVLITPGRSGSSWRDNEDIKKIRHKLIDDEEVGGLERMRPRSKTWSMLKHHEKGEHLTPLKRYLESKVDQKWDDIYSEIKKNNKATTAVGNHIYQHLWAFVNKNVGFTEDGKPFLVDYQWSSSLILLKPGTLYIDQQGYLRKVPEKEKQYNPHLLIINDNTYLIEDKNNQWWKIVFSNRMKKKVVDCSRQVWDTKTESYYTEKWKEEQIFPYYQHLDMNWDKFKTKCFSPKRKKSFDKHHQYWYIRTLYKLTPKELKQWQLIK